MFREYHFVSRELPVITYEQLSHISNKYKAGFSKVNVTFDLGITFSKIDLDEGAFSIGNYRYSIDDLLNYVKKDYVYILNEDKIYPVAYYKDGFYYKLYPVTFTSAPTIEISGIKMHRVVDTTPWEDTESKVSILKIKPGDEVLDICTGLGYTAIHAYINGGNITSIEKDPNVLDIASYNPWSKKLTDVNIILGDAYEVIKDLDTNSFQAIIHDPPRFSRAGQLYSIDFYKELYRVLSDDGKIFHYCGKVGFKRRGIDLIKGVAVRLRKVGFKVKLMRKYMGVYAYK